MTRTVLIMAGGTGGHVFPALAIAGELRENGFAIQWLGTAGGMEERVVDQAGIALNRIDAGGLRGKKLRTRLLAPFMLLRSLLQAMRVMRRVRPCCVLGMGGYVAGPGGVAAWLMRRPLLIHEQNAVAGYTNRLLAPLATRVMETFPGTFRPGARVAFTGNPVRRDISGVAGAAHYQDIEQRRLRILVLGGSLGAAAINRVIPRVLASRDDSCEIWHQAGREKLEQTLEEYRQAGLNVDSEGCRVAAFIDDMAAAYDWADLIIARAGATTVSEIAAAGRASILVPIPYAVDDHQRVNAEWLSGEGAAIVIRQAHFDVERLAAEVDRLLADRGRLAAMGRAARGVARPDAGERVASQCLEVCANHD